MPRMSLVESLQVLRAVRQDRDVVVSTMGSAREWMKLGTHPLDFVYAPSAMGQAPALGLGIALAQPDKRVIILNGDGCMLMNLGSLVTLTAAHPDNLTLIVCENSVYEVTGGQATAACPAARPGSAPVDFSQMALAAGFKSVWSFQDINDWRQQVESVLAAPGPRFVVLQVDPVPGGSVPRSPAPPVERAKSFAAALLAWSGSPS
ncbi:MAG: thiamine pyrophosphate-binding protein [Planctomycetes bacterium]|nr:thiamine pyrophosphate-binding protein [Planctomycetota bacterium]